MGFAWTARRNAEKKRLAQIASCLKSKSSDKEMRTAANNSALFVDSRHRTLEVTFNKIAAKARKKSYLARFKSPIHTLSGKYTPTAMMLLDFLLENDIEVGRWILAQAELLKQPHFNLYHCYGETALKRYNDWESKQVKKFPRKENRDKQTDSIHESIRLSIMEGHIAALSWIPQLKLVRPPDVSTALYYLLPHIHGWYALCYAPFREDVMESGLCDEKHMVEQWGKYKRSRVIQELCDATLEKVIQQLGKLAW